MNRSEVEWVARPSDDDDRTDSYMIFRVTEEWFAVDAEQLILPIAVIEKDGEERNGTPAILKQYGGERLLNDMLMCEQQLEAGSTWGIYAEPQRHLYVEPHTTD